MPEFRKPHHRAVATILSAMNVPILRGKPFGIGSCPRGSVWNFWDQRSN
jgi:hypothetical protein